MTTIPEVQLVLPGGQIVGAIRFPHSRELHAQRAVDGVVLTVPAEIELRFNPGLDGKPLVSAVRVKLAHSGNRVGVAEDVRSHEASRASRAEPLNLQVWLPASVLRALEQRRAGGPLEIDLQVDATLHVLVASASSEPVTKWLVGEPVWQGGQVRVTLDAMPWSNMLNATGFGENVFVEIPVPTSPGPEWDEIWTALRTARDALNRGGGATVWKSVITECRAALEKWRVLQAPDLGPGLPQPNRDDREARTWMQRLDQIREHLLYLANGGVHGPAGEYTREDAVLVLAALAGLLAVRKP